MYRMSRKSEEQLRRENESSKEALLIEALPTLRTLLPITSNVRSASLLLFDYTDRHRHYQLSFLDSPNLFSYDYLRPMFLNHLRLDSFLR